MTGLLVSLVLITAVAPIAAPAGWSAEPADGFWRFTPPDLPAADLARLEIYAVEQGSARAWIAPAWASVAKGYPGANRQIQELKDSQFLDSAVAVGMIADGVGTTIFVALLAYGDGERLLPALFVAGSKASFDRYLGPATTAVRGSIELAGPTASIAFAARSHLFRRPAVAAAIPAAPTAPGALARGPVAASLQPLESERVPDSSFKQGKPLGIFVGTSLLSGKAICLMFLEGGRITRAIPTGGLEEFSWREHQKRHAGDSGTYTLTDGGNLMVRWGDGAVHAGPLKATANGLEFYQKRYSKPQTASLTQLAGRWESTRTVGQLTVTHDLQVDPDGVFRWTSLTGGLVASAVAYGSPPAVGTAVASPTRNLSGTVSIRGLTATFRGNDGSVSSHTFQRGSGEPVDTFTLGIDRFHRVRK